MAFSWINFGWALAALTAVLSFGALLGSGIYLLSNDNLIEGVCQADGSYYQSEDNAMVPAGMGSGPTFALLRNCTFAEFPMVLMEIPEGGFDRHSVTVVYYRIVEYHWLNKSGILNVNLHPPVSRNAEAMLMMIVLGAMGVIPCLVLFFVTCMSICYNEEKVDADVV